MGNCYYCDGEGSNGCANCDSPVELNIELKEENYSGNLAVKESAKVKGTHIFTVCDCSSDEAKDLSKQIETLRINRSAFINHGSLTEELGKKFWKEYRALIEKLHSKFKVREYVIENITTTVGRTVLARRLSGNTTYTGIVNYTALGSSSTAPAIGDATLGTEVYRKALTSGTYLNNVAYLETFFTATETSGTYQEYGMFIDGTASANTGQLFNRFTQAITKSVTETLNVQSVVTFNDA